VKLFSDEHFPAEIAQAVRREMPNFNLQSNHETNLAGLLDQPLLAALDPQQRTLLTRDVNSRRMALKRASKSAPQPIGRSHRAPKVSSIKVAA
jgi:hypothetical protein